MKLRFLRWTVAVLVACHLGLFPHPVGLLRAEEYQPRVLGPSDEGEKAIARIRIPEGFRCELLAAEPHLANPVCFTIDERGRFYVAETFRHTDGVTDNRSHMNWLDADMAARTVADRVAMYRKYLPEKFNTFSQEHDRIRLLEDTDGDRKVDRATVFADGFNQPEDGIGAGLLARGGQVWWTCIPSLWLLADADGDGRADVRQTLSTGYGVHVAFIGHDLHGLRLGPDGKLYFTCGDRGLHVENAGEVISEPDCGTVLRCNLDGSDLEIFCTGLRNPQEIAFDDYGNLFTVDNNSDGGDQARLVYLVEGGDSGWRMGYQYLNVPTSRGPWNMERMWQPRHEEQPAHHLPPLANFSNGPSGLTYYPGTGLPERCQGKFFLCDFRGAAGSSGIRMFAVEPDGASFKLGPQEEFVWSVLATDVEFGWDGGLYLSDWTDGWNKPGKGRIYRVFDPNLNDPAIAETKTVIQAGFAQRSLEELSQLLAHRDQRIRQEAQFALAAQGEAAVKTLEQVAAESTHRLARLHAIWGLGQIARETPVVAERLISQLNDDDAEVRAQAAKTLGDVRCATAGPALLERLTDESPRVRFFAAQAVGKIGDRAALPPLVQLLRDNEDRDVYLRHAATHALSQVGAEQDLLLASIDTSPAVRLGVLLALRKLQSPAVARFLDDPEPRLVAEAARAIHDVPIPEALPALARILPRTGLAESIAWRAIVAHFRLGEPENAQALAAYAARANAPESMRLEALRCLENWAEPAGRDRVVGLWRPIEKREAAPAALALEGELAGIFAGPDSVRQLAATLAAKYELGQVGPLLNALVVDQTRSAKARAAALQALAVLKDAQLPDAIGRALSDAEPRLRAQAQRLAALADPGRGVDQLRNVLSKGEVIERQTAIATLAELNDPEADAALVELLDQLLAGQAPAETQLDLLEAAARRDAGPIRERLKQHEANLPADDLAAAFRETLAGGDAENGATVFFNKAEVSCVRCHKALGRGGEVGPNLAGLGKKKPREYLLHSLLDPNKDIAQGFETVVLALDDGRTVTGVLREETADQLRLITAEGHTLRIPKSSVEERDRGRSAMPEKLWRSLTKRELRDLVTFLAELPEDPTPGGD